MGDKLSMGLIMLALLISLTIIIKIAETIGMKELSKENLGNDTEIAKDIGVSGTYVKDVKQGALKDGLIKKDRSLTKKGKRFLKELKLPVPE